MTDPYRNQFDVQPVSDGTDRVRIGSLPADNPILSRPEALCLAGWLARASGANLDDLLDAYEAVNRK